MGAAAAAVASGPWVRGVLAQVEDEDIFRHAPRYSIFKGGGSCARKPGKKKASRSSRYPVASASTSNPDRVRRAPSQPDLQDEGPWGSGGFRCDPKIAPGSGFKLIGAHQPSGEAFEKQIPPSPPLSPDTHTQRLL